MKRWTPICAPGQIRPDVVLGDRFGASSAAHVTDTVEAAFRDAGLRVARNTPFARGLHYPKLWAGRPPRRHVVQIEIDRSLYMNEDRVEKSRNFAAFRTVMTNVMARIAEIGGRPMPLAAE